MWRFLPNEKRVIVSLIEDASRTDADIAELNGMRAGTVASARRRVLEAGALFYVGIPSFHKLGCEMIAFHKGILDPAISDEAKTSDYMAFFRSSPEVFDAIIGSNSVVFMSVFRDATEMENLMLRHNRFFSDRRKPSKARLSTTTFPHGMSKGTYTLNFAPLVHRFFGLDSPRPNPRPPVSFEVVESDLSENEKKVLIALVENPAAPDRKISSIVNLSRQAVTRIRRKLQDEEYYTLTCVPRLYRWGFEMFSAIHARFSADFVWSDVFNLQPKESVDYSFYYLTKPGEAVANHMISTYHDYTHGLESSLAWYHKNKAFESDPDITLMALEHCVEMKTFEFGPRLRNLLAD
ncbi:MAG: winged helix-turn-helix transcriptional regulator [Methanobacteriota archaeon]|nr:MAG: winged helix-turn-helix transcriptional regulator [Euryarchaeota archaeon]